MTNEITFWEASFINDTWGVFPTERKARAWVKRMERQRWRIYGIKPYAEAYVIKRRTLTLSELLDEWNGCNRAFNDT